MFEHRDAIGDAIGDASPLTNVIFQKNLPNFIYRFPFQATTSRFCERLDTRCVLDSG
jgi:hypothetical protein